jgi:transcriptional regulator with XRE-family HTH domain
MPSDTMQARWGEALRKLREERGLTLRSLGEKSDVDYRHLQKVELGKAGLSDERRIRVADALGVDPNELWAYPTEIAS